MNIDASLRTQWTPTADAWQIDLPEGWMQGRSAFGGLTAAAMAALGRRVVPDLERDLRLANIQLLAPVEPGRATGAATLLRAGRNITFVEVRMQQDAQLVATCVLVFAKKNDSTLNVAAPPPPETPDPESLHPLPFVRGVFPEFTQHVDMRWAAGSAPYSGGSEAAFTGVYRYRVPIGDVEGVLALLDTWPPPSLALAESPVPASTVSWTAHVLAVPNTFEQWFTFRYETIVGASGLHTIRGHLHDADGGLVGWTEQLVAVFG